jgi:hypothetical protein
MRFGTQSAYNKLIRNLRISVRKFNRARAVCDPRHFPGILGAPYHER